MPSFMFGDSGIDWANDTIKCLMIGAKTWTNNEQFVSDVASAEVSGTNYSRQTLTSKTVTKSYPFIYYDAEDVTFNNITVSGIEYFIIYKDTGDDSTSPILFRFDARDSGSPRNVVANPATLQFHSSGVFTEHYQ